MSAGLYLRFVGIMCLVAGARAEPLSKKIAIDFFRDIPSRNLKGLATRSDGRLVAGPTLIESPALAPAGLLWCIAPAGDPARFLVGTGPDGKIIELTVYATEPTCVTREIAALDAPHVFTLAALADGSILAGTSPRGGLYLVREGKPVAKVLLPVDSIFDLLLIDESTALAATGNPGRIYTIDLRKFATVGLITDKITDAKILAYRGITLFGEVRDRNVRRIVALSDGHVIAGSAPKGNVYRFPREGGAPVILQENRDAEVTDLLPQPNGDLFASIVFSGSTGESRIAPMASRSKDSDPPPPAQIERFSGRSALVWFPANGFPETLTSRSGMAFYRLARFDDLLVIAGGEQGELLGFDFEARLSLTFAGSTSSQVSGLVPLAGAPGGAAASPRFLLLRNNTPGFALLDFSAFGVREAETRRLDLGVPSLLGALRFDRLRTVSERDLAIDVRLSNGSDEIEGWGEWMPLQLDADSGWRADHLRGRYVRLRLRLSGPDEGATPSHFEIGRAALFGLPQNRRPVLQDFRVLRPNFGVIPAAEQPPPPNVSLNQLMQARTSEEEGRRQDNFLSSQVVPMPGTQVVLWTVTDPDNDRFVCTFSIRREGEDQWIDVAAGTTDRYAQFDTSHLPDGVYFTRLVVVETAPRSPTDRLTQTFETDDLIIDHSAPELIDVTAGRSAAAVVIRVHGRDVLSLLDRVEVAFNNGVRETVEQPADGVRDGREETFILEVPLAKVSNATSAEVTLYDAAGNGVARRVTW